MDYFDLIRTRESVRDYNPNKPVDKDILLKIADAGRIAPSASNKQPWKFIIVSSDNMLEKVRQCYPKDWYRNAPHILVVIGDRSKAWVRRTDGYNSIETDLTIAMDHMILAAEAEGVATCWIAAFDNQLIRDILELNDDEVIYSITPLGYPNDGYHKRDNKIRKSLEEIVEFI
jgi:nitroreductase|tara:strand:- start:496 stop:1014 length:519 start_codon:yes stop_codon:yes gene_type:complete